MRGVVTLCAVCVLFLNHVQMGLAQEMMSFKPEKPIICYYSHEHRPDHVGVSDKFKSLRQNASARTKNAVFEVEYIDFPADNLAKNAFQYAVDIWSAELTSSIPIRIRAQWEPLGPNVLGQALWGRAFANFGGEQHINTFYPVALAEKIAGKELNGDEPDIVASFSSNTAWYYGTDGNTPAKKMDLVTIVLHEIAHGLGFSDTYSVENSEGRVGLATGDVAVPFIFDLFVEDGSNEKLFHDFESPSNALGAALQNANLFFNTPLSVAALAGTRPKLFAPATFDGGSSISHLDEATFNMANDANRLMTPQIAMAESIHNPGTLLLAMLGDMGWINTRIEHTALKDTENKNGQPYVVTAVIKSDNGYDASQVKLHYSTDGTNFTIVNMTATGVANQFEASLPGSTVNWGYAYFISVADNLDRIFTNPGKIQEQGSLPEQGTYFFNIGPDLAAPEIKHTPPGFIFETDPSMPLAAVVTDNLGVKEVLVEYFINGGTLQTSVMQEAGTSGEYNVTISLPELSIGDEIEYRLVARDQAANENVSMLPVSGYFTVFVTGIMPRQNVYINDFNAPSNDFFGMHFSITTPVGFEDGAIHTTHPYPDGSGPDDESNYQYQLQVPILLNAQNAYIRFDEIVLVEPGEVNSEFEDSDFYDYVIVEGSTDGGVSWKPFAPGYDSRSHTSWLTRYNSDVVNDHSEAEGDQALYVERKINMLENGNFSDGQEVLIRFRLFADALASGWGWAIDNLSIQGPVTDVEAPRSTAFSVYPNPVQANLQLEFANVSGNQHNVQIADMQGRIIYSQQGIANSDTVKIDIDMGTLQRGVYIVRVTVGNAVYTRKFLKVSP